MALQVFGRGCDRRPIVLLHGFTGSTASWDTVAECLAEQSDTTIVAFPLPGHHTDAPVAAGWAGNIELVAAQMQRIESQGIAALPAHVCGYSLGARTALGLAVHAPEFVAQLTLIGGHPGLASDAERIERRASDQHWIDQLRHNGIEAFVAAWEAHPIFASQADANLEARQRQRAIRRAHDPVALAASLAHMGLGQMPDYRAWLAKPAMPVTLMTGQRDRKFTALAEEIVSQRNSTGLPLTHATIAQCGHNALLECPDRVAELIMRAQQEDS